MIESDNREVREFAEYLLNLDRLEAEKMLNRAREDGFPLQVVEGLIVPALDGMGVGWENGTVALAQIYMSSRICEELVDLFLPPSSPERISRPKMAIAQLDDYHALGKIIVYSALRASGYELQDYGILNSSKLAERICSDSIQIILISTLMLRSALQVKKVKKMLEAAGSPAKIIVGGAPFRFDRSLWQEVGADGMGASAMEAVRIVGNFMEEIQ